MSSTNTIRDDVFVPLICSLSDDAPGYNKSSSSDEIINSVGPICWKCDGIGTTKIKLGTIIICKVCKGEKRLQVKKSLQSNRKGEVTKRSFPTDWVTSENENSKHGPDHKSLGELIPKEGEQLCGLVGNWRIFQRFGGHRWTTDDIVTAWVAVKASKTLIIQIKDVYYGTKVSAIDKDTAVVSNYLDLGCGNGSVLMMTAKHLEESTVCIGIEARADAVSLARRSIQYNCGTDCSRITVRNRDFREIYSTIDSTTTELTKSSSSSTTTSESILPEGAVFDLITGTPPYFRVNFEVEVSTQTVQQALIRQGGMPTCKESAPARCKFRGGVEAYCCAAEKALSECGVFVVCENYLNHERVLREATQTGLFILLVQRVIGKEGKTPLFCVYTMIRKSLRDNLLTQLQSSTVNNASNPTYDNTELLSQLVRSESSSPVSAVDLTVRDLDGAWTPLYADMLREVSYPVVSLHPSGRY